MMVLKTALKMAAAWDGIVDASDDGASLRLELGAEDGLSDGIDGTKEDVDGGLLGIDANRLVPASVKGQQMLRLPSTRKDRS
jgi:hypothetical protein